MLSDVFIGRNRFGLVCAHMKEHTQQSSQQADVCGWQRVAAVSAVAAAGTLLGSCVLACIDFAHTPTLLAAAPAVKSHCLRDYGVIVSVC